ncbi:MAG: GNAT family N-acetyltransferase [Pseudomonadota bacterium]
MLMALNPTLIEPAESVVCDVRVRTRIVTSLDALDATTLQGWRALEDDAQHANVYLSADFVVPSLRHLTPDLAFVLLISERWHDGTWQAIALGIFTERRASATLFTRVLEAYRPPHGYLTGLLLHKECDALAIRVLFDTFLRKQQRRWRAVGVACFALPLVLSDAAADEMRAINVAWHAYADEPRATIRPATVPVDFVRQHLSRNSRRNYERKQRKLAALGDYQWRFVTGGSVTASTIDDFLALENTGFRRDAGTSLAAQPEHEAFFREMIELMRQRDKVFFTEICLDGRVIASTCNLRSGAFAYAFKLGWNPDYADYSVGVLNELELVTHMPECLADIRHMDSGAMPGSFMERLWPDIDTLNAGYFTFGSATTAFTSSIQKVAALKRRLKRQS